MKLKRYRPLLVLMAVVGLVPAITASLEANFYLTQLTMTAYYSLVALGLCLLMGYAGQISLGQAGFFAIGAYTSARLTTLDLSAFGAAPPGAFLQSAGLLLAGQDLYGKPILYLSPWLGCAAAVLLAVAVAFLLGKPVLKLKGHYLAMATLGFGVIIEKIVRGTKEFGAADGLANVPAFPVLPFFAVSGDSEARVANYLFAWAVVLLTLLLIINLLNSRPGRALRALHGSEEAANAMGVDTARFKLFVFVLGAVLAALAGVFLTHFNGSIGPGEAGVMKSVRYVSIVAVGGMANLWGTLVMGTALNFLSLRGVFGSYDDAVFGACLILVMLFAPDGFIRRRKNAAA